MSEHRCHNSPYMLRDFGSNVARGGFHAFVHNLQMLQSLFLIFKQGDIPKVIASI